MRRSAVATWVVLGVSVLVAGCGHSSADGPDSPPAAVATREPSAHEGEIKPSRQPYGGDGYYVQYAEWLRSDYVENLDAASLKQEEHESDLNMGVPTFDYAADYADLIVSGTVTGLRFVPEGTLTTFQVDRTAKGDSQSTVYVMQTSYVRPADNEVRETGNARVFFDGVQPMMFEGDRAVLLLRDLTRGLDPVQADFLGGSLGGARIYHAVRGAGQYRIVGGKVRAEKVVSETRRERCFDGKSESEIMDAAAARAGAVS